MRNQKPRGFFRFIESSFFGKIIDEWDSQSMIQPPLACYVYTYPGPIFYKIIHSFFIFRGPPSSVREGGNWLFWNWEKSFGNSWKRFRSCFVIRQKYRSWIRENWKISFVNSWIEPPWGGLLEDWRQFFVHIGAAWLSYRNRKAPEFRHHWKQKSRRCFPSHACSWAITGASAKLCTSKSHPSYNHKTDFIAFHPPTI